MTKLLIVSDTHGEVIKLEDLLRKYRHQYDIFVHLGDRIFDVYSLQETIDPSKKQVIVKGNMETELAMLNGDFPNDVEFTVEGLKVLATHGHRYSVHSTMIFLKKEALRRGVNVVLFGHTHEKTILVEDDIIFFNPGALKDNDYGLLFIDNGEVVNMEQGYLPEKI